MLEIFSSDCVIDGKLFLKLMAEERPVEESAGIGVLRESFSLSFNSISFSHLAGDSEKVPLTRHNMSRGKWEAIAGMITCG